MSFQAWQCSSLITQEAQCYSLGGPSESPLEITVVIGLWLHFFFFPDTLSTSFPVRILKCFLNIELTFEGVWDQKVLRPAFLKFSLVQRDFISTQFKKLLSLTSVWVQDKESLLRIVSALTENLYKLFIRRFNNLQVGSDVLTKCIGHCE